MFVAMTGHIYMYGEVGVEITSEKVRKEIDPRAEDYTVHISSVGGDVFVGYTIFNLLKNLKASTGKKITAHVEGLCASIMTLIVAACDEVIMNKTSQFMIHNPQIGNLSGDATELRNVADQLDKIKNLLIDVYVDKTGMSKDALWEMYDKETWLTAEEAVNMKFADQCVEAIKAVAKVDVKKFKADTMEKSVIDKLQAGFKNLFGLVKKFVAVVNASLADGTAVIIMAEEGEDLTGKTVTYEDGTPLPAGDHELATGMVITVDENSTITAATPKTEDTPSPEDMKANEDLKNEVAALKAKLAEKESHEATAQAQVAEIKNQFTALAKELKDLKGEPAGDAKPPKPGKPKFTNDVADDYDPMSDDIMKVLQSRNLR